MSRRCSVDGERGETSIAIGGQAINPRQLAVLYGLLSALPKTVAVLHLPQQNASLLIAVALAVAQGDP